MNWFITGTGTGVGKTFVTRLLVRAGRAAGLDTVAMKPLCCGERTDAEILRDAANGEISLNDVNPVWLRAPLAPYAASLVENRAIDLDLIRDVFGRLRASHRSLLVEGVGGWLVPITRDYLVRDLALEFKFPVVVVAANQLGTLNHTILTVESIRATGLECAGIILNNPAPPDESGVTNRAILEDILQLPVLWEIQPGQESLEVAVA